MRLVRDISLNPFYIHISNRAFEKISVNKECTKKVFYDKI